jgi:hypothetical protein
LDIAIRVTSPKDELATVFVEVKYGESISVVAVLPS